MPSYMSRYKRKPWQMLKAYRANGLNGPQAVERRKKQRLKIEAKKS